MENLDSNSENFFKEVFFPYENIRIGQDEFIKLVYESCINNKNLLISAPTGIGKTVSVLCPTLKYCKDNQKKIIYLTSRQNQLNQVINTLRDISDKSSQLIKFASFVSKKNMCAHPKSQTTKKDFSDFCKDKIEKKKCYYYLNMKSDQLNESRKDLIYRSNSEFFSIEKFVEEVGEKNSDKKMNGKNYTCNFCPYELMSQKVKGSIITICDFNYMFIKPMREKLFTKLGVGLKDCVLIVDEAHNLDQRVKNTYSLSLDFRLIENFNLELNKFIEDKSFDKYTAILTDTLNDLFRTKRKQIDSNGGKFLVEKEEFLFLLKTKLGDISVDQLCSDLKLISTVVSQIRRISFAERILLFISTWKKINSRSFITYIEKQYDSKFSKTYIYLKIQLLDASKITSKIVNHTHNTIFMSGTLNPTKMFCDLLGVDNSHCLELESPFSASKQLTLIDKTVTTKYTERRDSMFEKIANNIENYLNAVITRNALIFFPSYDMQEKIMKKINVSKLNRKILVEIKGMQKKQKESFIQSFKKNDDFFNPKATVLFAVSGGSFSEGLDLPNKALELVIVVGFAFGILDLVTKQTIEYFERKFHKGKEYGYINPAISKIVQAAGRCIRTNRDKGAIILMDNRFDWPIYRNLFPSYWQIKKSENIKSELDKFFEK